MRYQQLFQSNVALYFLTKCAFLVAEVAIVTAGMIVFATANKAYASDDSIRLTPIPALQEMLEARRTLGSAKDLGTVELDLSNPGRPCYTGEQAGCIYGFDFGGVERQQELNKAANSIQIRSFPPNEPSAQVRLFDDMPFAQVHLFEISF